MNAPLRNGLRDTSKVTGDDIWMPGPDFSGEPRTPTPRSDPRGPAAERPTRLDVKRLVPHHPCHPRIHAKVPRGGEEHPRARFAASAIG